MKTVEQNIENNYLKILESKINNAELSLKKQAYYKRMKKLLSLRDLSSEKGHPVEMIVDKIVSSDFYNGFDRCISPEIVGEYETFDLFNFSLDHVVRRESDSYFIEKSDNSQESILLRPHTSVMWYHYLIKQGGKEKLKSEGKVEALSYGKVYRVDELDTTHHECFHQIDGLKISDKAVELITQDTLKEVLSQTIISIYGPEIEYRFSEDSFPYTVESLEVEIYDGNRWVEILGAGIVHPSVLEKLGLDSEKYNGWAFGFGIDRLAMAFKDVPDIRILWSDDERIVSQWGNFEPYKAVSSYPLINNDITFIAHKSKFILDEETTNRCGEIELEKSSENDWFEITRIAREVGEGLIEQMKIIDVYINDKAFGIDNKSISIRITFRSLERTLTNEEINKMYFEIRKKIETELGYILR